MTSRCCYSSQHSDLCLSWMEKAPSPTSAICQSLKLGWKAFRQIAWTWSGNHPSSLNKLVMKKGSNCQWVQISWNHLNSARVTPCSSLIHCDTQNAQKLSCTSSLFYSDMETETQVPNFYMTASIGHKKLSYINHTELAFLPRVSNIYLDVLLFTLYGN